MLVSVVDLYFQGEYDQYMTVIISWNWRSPNKVVEYEFFVQGITGTAAITNIGGTVVIGK